MRFFVIFYCFLMMCVAQGHASPLQDPVSSPGAFDRFYIARDQEPFWITERGARQPLANDLIHLLEKAWQQGLDPLVYNLEPIQKALHSGTEAERLQADKDLTRAALRYARDMTGRNRDIQYPKDFDIQYWRKRTSDAAFLDNLALSRGPLQDLEALEPKGDLYQALKKELIKLSVHNASEKDAVIAFSSRRSLKPGQRDPAVPALRARFGDETIQDADLYDEALAVKVMEFQKSSGLDTDGIVGQRTLALLNMSREEKRKRLIANMERLRWRDEDRPDRYVLVNVPSASLWAMDKKGVVLEMPVVVGREKRPTPVLRADITGVRFNPNWTVPSTIKKEDFLPALQQDPFALAKRDIRILYKGNLIDPSKVDWTTIKPADMGLVSLVQDPSDENPLGKVRVLMNNAYNIYLHDTNDRSVFKSSERYLSSGCVRVAKPEELADFILAGEEGWTPEKRVEVIAKGKLRDIVIKQPIPIYITYQTVWLDGDGRLIYGRDVYGADEDLYKRIMAKRSIHSSSAILK